MLAVLLTGLCLVVPVLCQGRSLDKTGTSPRELGSANEKALVSQGFSEPRSLEAEREGTSRGGFHIR